MKCYGVKFLLKGNHFFLAFMPEMQARELVKKFSRGEFTGNQFLTGQAQVIPGVSSGDDWAVPLDSIIGMHTFEAVIQSQPNHQPGASFPTGPFVNTSGIYYK